MNYDIKIIFKEAIKEYNLLKANIDAIKDYNSKLELYTKKEFMKSKELMYLVYFLFISHSKLFSFKTQISSLFQKFNILIERLENKKDIELITENKFRVEKSIMELPAIIENIFEKEKEITLKFINVVINE